MDFRIKKTIHININAVIQVLRDYELENLLGYLYSSDDIEQLEEKDFDKILFALGEALVKKYE